MATKEHIEREIKKLCVDTMWNHKIHEKDSDRQKCFANIIYTVSVLLLALTASSIISVVFTNVIALKIISAIIACITFFVNIIALSVDCKSLSKAHKKCALGFLDLRNEIYKLLSNMKINKYTNDNEIICQRDLLYETYSMLCKQAPSTSSIAMKRARISWYNACVEK